MRNEFLDMAATIERLDEYRMHNTQFCKRLYDYMCIMFTTQVIATPPNSLVPDQVLCFPRSRRYSWAPRMDYRSPANIETWN